MSRRGISRVWSSPSATTFASTAAQSLSAILVLPLVVHRFDAATVAAWALFGTIVSLQSIVAAGFTPTFVRSVALAHGGQSDIASSVDTARGPGGEPQWDVIGEIATATRVLYGAFALASAIVVGTLGSLLVTPMIDATAEPGRVWIAWACVVGGICATTFANAYTTIVEGLNHVALLRRWDAFFAILATASAAIVLTAGGDILALVAVSQSFSLARLLRSIVLARQIDAPSAIWTAHRGARRVLASMWPAAWRSSVGVASTFGVQQASGVFYAQIADARQVAAYLLAVRLLDMLSALARSPFYSRIPLLVRLRASGQLDEQRRQIRSGMGLTYWLLLAGLVGAAIAGSAAFDALGSDTPFPPRVLWLGMGLAILLERYGAMHVQVFTTTNRVVWHIAGAGYAVIYLAVAGILYRSLGVYAFPIAMLAGHLGWYSWYCASRSYRALSTSFWAFERTLFLPPFLLAAIAFIAAFLTR